MRDARRLCVFCMSYSNRTRRCPCGRWHCDVCGAVLCIDCMVDSIVQKELCLS